MTYKDHVIAGDLLRVLAGVPSKTIIDIADDPALNNAGPLAMWETGQLDVLKFKLREDGTPALLMWPLEIESLEDRYENA